MTRVRSPRAIAARRAAQRGLFLIEALIAILIFALGVLGMIAMGGAAVSAQSDAQYRSEAQAYAESIAATIALNATRTGDAAALATSLAPFVHRPTGAAASCDYGGADAGNGELLVLTQKIANLTPGVQGMPGAAVNHQQVTIDTDLVAGHNKVTIILCWQTPSDTAMRQHTLVTYVNGTKDS